MTHSGPVPQTTAFDAAAWLREQGRSRPEACHQEQDWCEKLNCAAAEIERMRVLLRMVEDQGFHPSGYLIDAIEMEVARHGN